jgi:outer membrane protein assembly factor BamB
MCRSTYQVDPGLKGKRMRCPNAICRHIFEVRDVAEPLAPIEPPPTAPAPVPAPVPRQSGAVGDLVPILSAEIAAAEIVAPPRPKPAAQPKPPLEPSPAEVAAPTVAQQAVLDEFFAGAAPLIATTSIEPDFTAAEVAPPVRPQGMETTHPFADGMGFFPLDGVTQAPPDAVPRRTRRRSAVVLLALLAVTIGTTWWLLTDPGPSDEEARFERALKDYQERNFGEAAGRFRGLVLDFQQSDNRSKYQFYAELSELSDQVHRLHATWEETRACIVRFDEFLKLYKTEPLLENHKADVAEGLYKLVDETVIQAGLSKDAELLELAKNWYKLAGGWRAPTQEQAKALDKAIQQVSEEIALAEKRTKLLTSLRHLQQEPSAEAVYRAREIAVTAGVSADPEVKEILQGLQQAHCQSIKFSTEWAANAYAEIVEDGPPSLLVLPFLGSPPPAAAAAKERPVFAVVRGVVYAFDPLSGRLRWARRVGVDTQTVPLWLPPTTTAPESVMVPSSDQGGLLALDSRTGAVLWFQPLPEICRGQPVVVGPRAYVACRAGLVFEIDTAGGRCLGAFMLNEPLTWQGVHQPGTNLIYFAADRLCVCALDISSRSCPLVVYSGHAPGALLCGPVVVPLLPSGTADQSKPGLPRGKLLLSVAKGPASTDVLSYALPLTGPDQQPKILESLPGRLWFPPVQNGEYLALLSDQGSLSIFGIKQPNNLDPDLFAQFRSKLTTAVPKSGRASAQVVHIQAGDFWLLAKEQMYCFRAGFDVKNGWTVNDRHIALEPLGIPLHDSQVQANRSGGTTLYVTTEAPDGSSCWLSAIDAQHPGLLWQRQLGWMSKGQPVVLGNYVLGRDTNGLLLQLDVGKLITPPGSEWRITAKPLTGVLKTTDAESWLLPAKDGKTALVVAIHGLEARVSRFHDGSFLPPLRYALEAIPGGTPAIVDDTVVLPLANGRLCRLLPSGKATIGETWRSKDADAKATGHVVAVSAGLLACTNGSRGVTLWRVDGEDWQKVASATVAGRIVAPPVVVSLGNQTGEWGLCVADTDRAVTLLHVGGLRKLRHWAMSDNITAGPFVRGASICVILGGRRLVLLDPANDQPWGHTFRADIVGQPELVDGMLIVADVDGQFQAVDPQAGLLATERFVGLGYKLRANVAPATAPVPFGADWVLAPLTDGTVLLLARQWFRPRILGFSTVR